MTTIITTIVKMFNEKKRKTWWNSNYTKLLWFSLPISKQCFFLFKKKSHPTWWPNSWYLCCVHFTNISNVSSIYLITLSFALSCTRNVNQLFYFFHMFSYNFQYFIIICVNVKFNLNWYTFHGHEKNTCQYIFSYPCWQIKEKNWGSY